MRIRHSCVFALLACAVASCGGGDKAPTEPGGPYPLVDDVFMPNISTFSPFQVDLARTGVVRFNFTAELHDVTFSTPGLGTPADILQTVAVVVERRFNTAGTFNYYCRLHPQMTGRIVVH